MAESRKYSWGGTLTSIQPRVRLTRSYDQRQHTYFGYVLTVRGYIMDEEREVVVAVGAASQTKQQMRAGDVVRGQGADVEDRELEVAEVYKVSQLEVVERGRAYREGPPWRNVPPSLEVYRERGSRRLDPKKYTGDCAGCSWGCKMAVEMILDPWQPERRRYRTETFCYGPLSCPLYRAGPTRKVPGRKGSVFNEEDWVDEQDVSHRGPDE